MARLKAGLIALAIGVAGVAMWNLDGFYISDLIYLVIKGEANHQSYPKIGWMWCRPIGGALMLLSGLVLIAILAAKSEPGTTEDKPAR